MDTDKNPIDEDFKEFTDSDGHPLMAQNGYSGFVYLQPIDWPDPWCISRTTRYADKDGTFTLKVSEKTFNEIREWVGWTRKTIDVRSIGGTLCAVRLSEETPGAVEIQDPGVDGMWWLVQPDTTYEYQGEYFAARFSKNSFFNVLRWAGIPIRVEAAETAPTTMNEDPLPTEAHNP